MEWTLADADPELLTDGVVTTSALLKGGASPADLRRLTGTGDLRRLRFGWLAIAGADDAVVQAVGAGGVLSCVSALKLRGAWRPLGSDLHVRLSEHHSRDRQTNLRVCRPRGQNPSPLVPVDPLEMALRCASVCITAPELVAVMDSLIHQRLATRHELENWLATEPHHIRSLVDRCDAAESGTESLVRQRLRGANVDVRSQVGIPGVGRVDLLVGNSLVIEVDSRAHHTGEDNYAKDRRRDRRLMRMGYMVIRLTWAEVMFHWDEVVDDIMAIIRSRWHRRMPVSLDAHRVAAEIYA